MSAEMMAKVASGGGSQGGAPSIPLTAAAPIALQGAEQLTPPPTYPDLTTALLKPGASASAPGRPASRRQGLSGPRAAVLGGLGRTLAEVSAASGSPSGDALAETAQRLGSTMQQQATMTPEKAARLLKMMAGGV